MKKIFALLLLPVLLAGCSSITNLTPSRYPRDDRGYYRVEAKWNSNRQVVLPGTFEPQVMLPNSAPIPMHAVPLVQDRWEAFVPIPSGQDQIFYRYKFDFMINTFGKPEPDSLLSPEYKLKIISH